MVLTKKKFQLAPGFGSFLSPLVRSETQPITHWSTDEPMYEDQRSTHSVEHNITAGC
jgi:hypothetical protein